MFDWVHPRFEPALAPWSETELTARLDGAFGDDGSLVSLLGGASPLLVVVNDPHRDTATRPVLAALGRGLRRTRRGSAAVDLLIASGSHPLPSRLRREAFEARLTAGVNLPLRRVAWHDCDAPDLVALGGRRVHPWLASAERVLAVGSVEPHYFAGLTGPHKTITVGLWDRASITANHTLAMAPTAAPFALTGNPVFDDLAHATDQLTQGRRVGAVALVQHGATVVALSTGDPLLATGDALPTARRLASQRIESPVDLLCVRMQGALSVSLYQADKGIKNHEAAVRDGGVLLLEAVCGDGIGPDRFVTLLQKAHTYAEARARVDRLGYRLGDHKALRLLQLTDPACRGVRLLVSSAPLHEAGIQVPGMQIVANDQVARQAAEVLLGPDRRRALAVDDAGNRVTEVDAPG